MPSWVISTSPWIGAYQPARPAMLATVVSATASATALPASAKTTAAARSV